MDGNCLLRVCIFAVWSIVPASSQDSASMDSMYLISGPVVLQAGTPTPLAVTILTDCPVRVLAQVTQGTSALARAEDTFPGGLTGILTLPQISGSSISQSPPLSLVVRGYQDDKLIFSNTTKLGFNSRTVSTFIQTDGSRYQPGDTVRIRTVSVQTDDYPYGGMVDISVRDPGGNVVRRWDSVDSHLGVVSTEFPLSHASPNGQWRIAATANDMTDEKSFIVEIYEPPHFEVTVKTSPIILVGEDISGTVTAQDSSGQPVQGTLSVSVTSAVRDSGHPLSLNETKEIHGSAQFSFRKDQLSDLHQYSSAGNNDIVMQMTACVTEISTGFKVNSVVDVHFMKNTYQLTFYNFPHVPKPSLHFAANLKITRYDRKPLSPSELMSPVTVEVTQRTSGTDAKSTAMTLAVPEDGVVHVRFRLQDRVESLFIQAKFMSGAETLELYSGHTSPSGSYIQILPVGSFPAQAGEPLAVDVESTFQPRELHYVVSSRGQVVAAGTKTSSSFSLTPKTSWSPEACITIYCFDTEGEVAKDSVHVPIHQLNKMPLNWRSDKAGIRDQVFLAATVTEPQVGILAPSLDGDKPVSDYEHKGQKECCGVMVLTDARLHKTQQAPEHEKGPPGDDLLMTENYWRQWMEQASVDTWPQMDTDARVWESPQVPAEHGIRFRRDVEGITPEPQANFLSLDVPACLVRGEEIVLEVKVFNSLEQDLEVGLLVEQNEAYEFVLAGQGEISVVNSRIVTVGSRGSASALFPIRPVAVGQMEISVDAVANQASAKVIRTVLVKPEGVEQYHSETLFLELIRTNNSKAISFAFPPDVVAGSRRAHVAVVGDILGLSMGDVDSLVDKPLGCGEQNMIHFAPHIFVLKYLEKVSQVDDERKARSLGYMREAYERELSYQREDGSFSAFGASDTSGSTWLTAYVLRCFLQAQSFLPVDQRVVSRAMDWLLGVQSTSGEFTEVGRVIHTELRGGLEEGPEEDPVALTAYVLMTLLEDETYVDTFRVNVTLATAYLEDKVGKGGLRNYSLCLSAYALAMANSAASDTALAELTARADVKDGVMMWTTASGLVTDESQSRSAAQIEMSTYVLLAMYKRGKVVEAIPIMKWLSRQRDHLGGYGTTQDTVIALQALSVFAAISGASSIDLRLSMNTSSSAPVSYFSINATTYLNYQKQEIAAENNLLIDLYMEGRGFALFQMNVFYNMESRAFAQSLQRNMDNEAFSLNVNVFDSEEDLDHMLLSICTRLRENQGVSQTGMAIMDVGLLSGFSLAPLDGPPEVLIRKVDTLPGKVSLYLDSLNTSEVCIKVHLIRDFRVSLVKDAVVQVYDYYEPRRRAVRTYNSEVMQSLRACTFCGADCNSCRSGLGLSASSSIYSSQSRISSVCSLGGLVVAIAAFLL